MRRLWLAVLPLFWSCADNLPDEAVEQARLLDARFPDVIVAGWPDSLEIRVEAQHPAGDGWEVELRVSGPGLAAPLQYSLLDDGGWNAIEQPGPGQATHSGDNVPGDGWYTTRLSADFTDGLGSFSLQARLLHDGEEVDRWTEARERLVNRPPVLVAVDAPAALASGSRFLASLTAGDPDGLEDLLSADLVQPDGVMRSWPFTRQDDSLFTLEIGPELAAGRQGPDTLRLTLTDRVGQSASQSIVVDLENAPPAVDGASFLLELWVDGEQRWDLLSTADTLRLPLPATGASFFRISLDVMDPQTLDDIELAAWSIERSTVSEGSLHWYPLSDLGPGEDGSDAQAGDGRHSAVFQLPFDAPVVERHLRMQATDRVGQIGNRADWVLWVVPAAGSPRGSVGGPEPTAGRITR